MRKDDWDRKGPDVKAALGCKKIAVFGGFAVVLVLALCSRVAW